MIIRLLGISFFTAGLVGTLAACSAEKADTDEATHDDHDDGDGDDAAVDTADTAGGGGGGGGNGLKTISYVSMNAFFGWDETTGATRAVTIDGTDQAPVLLINFGTADWSFGLDDVDNYCSVQMDITGLGNATWTPDVGMWVGFDVVAGTPAEDDCADFDTSAFGGDMSLAMSSLDYAIALGGEVSPTLADAIEQQLGASYLDLFVGGYLESDFIGGSTADGYALALEVDPSFNVTLDASGMGTYIDKYSMSHASGVVNGYYMWYSPIFTFSR